MEPRAWAGMGGRIGRGTERRRDLREARDDPDPTERITIAVSVLQDLKMYRLVSD